MVASGDLQQLDVLWTGFFFNMSPYGVASVCLAAIKLTRHGHQH